MQKLPRIANTPGFALDLPALHMQVNLAARNRQPLQLVLRSALDARLSCSVLRTVQAICIPP